MHLGAVILLGTAAWPLASALRAMARTTLRPSLLWCAAAWTAWLLALTINSVLASYLALSLTGCAGVAVLGARRPGVGAWNFVVAGLLAVLLLPVAQGWGTPRVETAQLIFIGATLAVSVGNYLPTRLGFAVSLCGLGCATELAGLTGTNVPGWLADTGRLCLGAGPWVGLPAQRRKAASTPLARVWLSFRDRFGFVWAQRAREQFNRAAENAEWGIRLTWHGFERRDGGEAPTEAEILQTLTAVLKRFGPP